MVAGGWVKVCEPKEKGECYQQTCGGPDEAFDLAVWGRGRGECLDECGLSLQGNLERWSWESYSGRSCHLEVKRTKNGHQQLNDDIEIYI